jgi:hypothetical protein
MADVSREHRGGGKRERERERERGGKAAKRKDGTYHMSFQNTTVSLKLSDSYHINQRTHSNWYGIA